MLSQSRFYLSTYSTNNKLHENTCPINWALFKYFTKNSEKSIVFLAAIFVSLRTSNSDFILFLIHMPGWSQRGSNIEFAFNFKEVQSLFVWKHILYRIYSLIQAVWHAYSYIHILCVYTMRIYIRIFIYYDTHIQSNFPSNYTI